MNVVDVHICMLLRQAAAGMYGAPAYDDDVGQMRQWGLPVHEWLCEDTEDHRENNYDEHSEADYQKNLLLQ